MCLLKYEALTGNLAVEYTGAHQDSIDSSLSTEKIYHWYIANANDVNMVLNKNNVVFAGHCWQMLRTTDTGGVKLIYNGELENNQCLQNRGDHIGYAARSSEYLTGNYLKY